MNSSSNLQPSSNRHVVMLLNNPCVNDSRVIKSAKALVTGGWRVTVLCRHDKGLPIVEEIDGVTYQRIEPLCRDIQSNIRRVRSYLQSILSPSPLGTEPAAPVQGGRHLITRTSFLDGKRRFPESKFKRILRSFGRTTLPLLRKPIKLLTYPARTFYSLYESDTFKTIVYRRAVQLRPDVVHCHDLSTLPAGVAISKACGCKLVYDSHELEMHRNAKYTEATKRKRRKLEQHGIKRADAVITVSDSIADHLKDDYQIRRPHVIMNAPDFDEHERPTRTVRDDLRLSAETPLAVYVGSVTVNRGLDYVIKALEQYPELHFATVGPRNAATAAQLHELAIQLGVSNRLHFVDPVKPSTVVGYISSSDVSVLPIQNVCLSYYYCMPNKLLESVFAGIPVAVANLAEMRRFVELFNCGLVMDERSPGSIASILKTIIKNRNSFILANQIRSEINSKYSWTAQAHKLRELYDKIFSEPPATEGARP